MKELNFKKAYKKSTCGICKQQTECLITPPGVIVPKRVYPICANCLAILAQDLIGPKTDMSEYILKTESNTLVTNAKTNGVAEGEKVGYKKGYDVGYEKCYTELQETQTTES